MKIDLTGKRALIAGGSRGIGLAIADAYAQAGADVSICARSEGPLRQAEAALNKHGHKVLATSCDLGDANAIKQWVEASAQSLGGIDILVNNASGFGRTDDEAGWAVSVQIDLMATVRACHAAMPYLEARGGSILHISSISGLGASVRTPPYGAIKAVFANTCLREAMISEARLLSDKILEMSSRSSSGFFTALDSSICRHSALSCIAQSG